MATASKDDLIRFVRACDELEARGYNETGIAYAMGFNEVRSFRAFMAIVNKNIREIEEEEGE